MHTAANTSLSTIGASDVTHGSVLIRFLLAHLREPLVICVLAYIGGAVLLSPGTYLSLLLVYSRIFAPAFALVLFVAKVADLVVRYRFRSVSALKDDLYLNGLRYVMLPVYFIAGFSAFTTFKINIPHWMSFYADPYLASLDRLLHGTDAWRLAHAVTLDAVEYIEVVYTDVFFLPLLAAVISAILVLKGAELARFLGALFLTIALPGTLLATVLSSVGPIYYDYFYKSDRFFELDQIIATSPALEKSHFYSQYLLDSYLSDSAVLGSGISAMPSMHVAISVLVAWFFTSRSWLLGCCAWAFAGVTLFGSVYTGWHYAVDGYISIIVVSIIWIATTAWHNRMLLPGAPDLRKHHGGKGWPSVAG
jgi:PAP2 superfamily